MAISEKVKEIIVPILQKLHVELFDVSYKKEGKDYVLRILLDKDDGTSLDLDTIVEISEKISPILDEADIIGANYVLDIASVGAERPLKVTELEKYVDRYINVSLHEPIENNNIYEGELKTVNEQEITLIIRIKNLKKEVKISRDAIARVRLAIKF